MLVQSAVSGHDDTASGTVHELLGTWMASATSYERATQQIIRWALNGESRYVIAANVHVLIEARHCRELRAAVDGADMVVPDGVPLVWMLRVEGHTGASRVYGPELMLHVCAAAELKNVRVALIGSTEPTLQRLCNALRIRFPALNIACQISPPFGPNLRAATPRIVDEIGRSGSTIVFVGLGCPKQEVWMADIRGSMPGVMLGVGAAFDFIAGLKPQAPHFIQRLGLEWLFRLVTEPRRLWRRYLFCNSEFLLLAIIRTLSRLRHRNAVCDTESGR